jgi:hypothetical protein
MYVCMYACMYVCMYVCLHVCTHHPCRSLALLVEMSWQGKSTSPADPSGRHGMLAISPKTVPEQSPGRRWRTLLLHSGSLSASMQIRAPSCAKPRAPPPTPQHRWNICTTEPNFGSGAGKLPWRCSLMKWWPGTPRSRTHCTHAQLSWVCWWVQTLAHALASVYLPCLHGCLRTCSSRLSPPHARGAGRQGRCSTPGLDLQPS